MAISKGYGPWRTSGTKCQRTCAIRVQGQLETIAGVTLFTDRPFSFSPGVPIHVPAELIAVTSEEGVLLPVEVMLKVFFAKLIPLGNRIAATAGVAVVTSTVAE